MPHDRDLTGIRVHHDSKLCCLPNAIVARVDDKCSAFELRCAECNSRICSLPKEVVSFLRGIVRVFGTPSASIYLPRAVIRKRTEMANYTREDVSPSRWFKAADVTQPRNLTIKEVERIELKDPTGESKDKLVVRFENEKKSLVLNGVNYDAIADLYGDGTEGWSGKEIQLFQTSTRMGNKSVPCVRVRVASGLA